MKVLRRLWQDDAGVVLSAELVMVVTITVIGVVVGLAVLRDSVTNELADTAGAIDDVNQSYDVEGIQGHSAAVAGFGFDDNLDYCDDDNDNGNVAGAADQCVVIASSATTSGVGEATGVAGSDVGN